MQWIVFTLLCIFYMSIYVYLIQLYVYFTLYMAIFCRYSIQARFWKCWLRALLMGSSISTVWRIPVVNTMDVFYNSTFIKVLVESTNDSVKLKHVSDGTKKIHLNGAHFITSNTVLKFSTLMVLFWGTFVMVLISTQMVVN